MASYRGAETLVWNRCSYQVPVMVGTNYSMDEKHIFYNTTVQSNFQGGGYCSTKVVEICAYFVDMVNPAKNKVQNGIK